MHIVGSGNSATGIWQISFEPFSRNWGAPINPELGKEPLQSRSAASDPSSPKRSATKRNSAPVVIPPLTIVGSQFPAPQTVLHDTPLFGATCHRGAKLGEALGTPLGAMLGSTLGIPLGATLGVVLGATLALGTTLGAALGVVLGSSLGSTLGVMLGSSLGAALGVESLTGQAANVLPQQQIRR